MADIFELTLALDLRDELSEGELADLRWHLGLGPQPETLRIVTEFPVVVEDDHGEPTVEDHPEPLLGQHCEAFEVGGALTSVLLRRQDTRHGAWALASRQEIHPDQFEETGALLSWLAARACDAHRPVGGTVDLGWIRFCESRQVESLLVRDGEVIWPS